jgi:RNA polymerase sigma factor (sigma-70 family)
MYQPEHWQKWREKGFSRAWAAKCALNIALDFITGMNAIESRFISAEDCKPQYESHPDERTDMFSEIARKETDRELEAAIGELTPGQQEALRLRFFEDLSFPRIAELLGTTEDAVRMLVSRALPRLGKRLLKIRFNADAALAAYSSYAQ